VLASTNSGNSGIHTLTVTQTENSSPGVSIGTGHAQQCRRQHVEAAGEQRARAGQQHSAQQTEPAPDHLLHAEVLDGGASASSRRRTAPRPPTNLSMIRAPSPITGPKTRRAAVSIPGSAAVPSKRDAGGGVVHVGPEPVDQPHRPERGRVQDPPTGPHLARCGTSQPQVTRRLS
jgi:hypothetical protein